MNSKKYKAIHPGTISKYIIFPFILLVLSAGVRISYYRHAPGIIWSEDTYGYFEYGSKMVEKMSYVSDWRTPVYPLLLHLPLILQGRSETVISSPASMDSLLTVMSWQTAVGSISIPILYYALILAGLSPLSGFLYSLFITFNIIVFSWDRMLLTESLAASWLIAVTLVFILLLKNQRLLTYTVFLLLLLFGFLLRPVYILFPLIPISLLLYFHRNRKAALCGILMLAVFVVILRLYTQENRIKNRYDGVSRISDINLLGKILQFNLPADAGKQYSAVYQTIIDYRQKNGVPMPWRYMERYPAVYDQVTAANYNQMKDFNTAVITHNLPEFTVLSLFQIPQALTDTTEKIVLVDQHRDFTAFFYQKLFLIYRNMQFLTFMLIPAFFMSLYFFLKKPTVKNSAVMFMGAIGLYQILFSVFFSYGEFGRLISVAQPEMYLFCLYWFYAAAKFLLKRRRFLSHPKIQ